MPIANMSATSQKLYNCIAGSKFVLDDTDFPDFSKAIEYSIATPGCWCFETLQAKASEFGNKPNPAETYLRITLNENNGESPGIPYVMEIWPVGHYSPIHNHGGSSAIIRVLHGSIHVKLFSFLGGSQFGSADFKKDDVTWLNPVLNQVHQLENTSSGTKAATCITIQCYMYEAEDSTHYDYFDYINADGTIQQFEPNSDMAFMEFKETVRREWASRNSQANQSKKRRIQNLLQKMMKSLKNTLYRRRAAATTQ
jgi:predicted metal-dependent enzyme (double-stranded beta helix superfamily)